MQKLMVCQAGTLNMKCCALHCITWNANEKLKLKGVKKNLTEHFDKRTISYGSQDQFKDRYDQIYTIGYYSGFYSSLKDENWANGGHFEFWSGFHYIFFTFILKIIIYLRFST